MHSVLLNSRQVLPSHGKAFRSPFRPSNPSPDVVDETQDGRTICKKFNRFKRCNFDRCSYLHVYNRKSSAFNVPFWLEELRGDEDQEFLTDGLIIGFQLVPCNTRFYPAEMNNYVIVQEKPTVVSAIGVVTKPDSNDVRIIHDCSMPSREGF